MKRILTGVLALVLAASVSVPALAVDTKAYQWDVNAEYRPGDASPEKVAVDIVWEDMIFHYTAGAKTWDPTTHQVRSEDGTWEDDARTIALTNHSNVPVLADFAFAGESVTGEFDLKQLDLRSARGTTADAAPNGETHFSVTDGNITESGKVGTITVTVSVKQTTDYVDQESYTVTEDSSIGGWRVAAK